MMNVKQYRGWALLTCLIFHTLRRSSAASARGIVDASLNPRPDSMPEETRRRRNGFGSVWPHIIPASNIGLLGRASKQLAVHIAAGRTLGGLPLSTTPRVLCLSGVATYCAARHFIRRSEAAQRACFFWKRAGPIVAHYKWTQFWLKATKAPVEHRHIVYKSLHDRYCAPSLDLILGLKGLYVKIGQVMSSRTDFLPLQYSKLFATLQDSIPQWPVEEAIDVARAALKSERGLELEDVFESIDAVALGCASIGQVHRAVLKEPWVDSDPNYNAGKVVAVKIMHPEAKKRFACDFQVFKWLTRVAMPGWQTLLEELERRLMTEFDYRTEAKSQVTVRNNLLKSPYKSRVRVPQTYVGLTCQHMLVMEMLEGKKLADALQERLSQIIGGDKEKVVRYLAQRQREIMTGERSSESSNIVDLLNIHGLSGVYRAWKALTLYRKAQAYIDLLINVHGYQIFQTVAFSADPHPGNILELPDGKLGLIDFGQTKFLTDDERLSFAQVVVDLGSRAPPHKIAESMRHAGFRTQKDEDGALAEYAALFFDSDHASFEKGHSTPQHYFQTLMASNPLIAFPESAVMVARVSVLFRGAGSMLNYQVKTADNWLKYANEALEARATTG